MAVFKSSRIKTKDMVNKSRSHSAIVSFRTMAKIKVAAEKVKWILKLGSFLAAVFRPLRAYLKLCGRDLLRLINLVYYINCNVKRI